MPYTRVSWVDDVTPLDQAHLNQMDAGILTLDTGKVDIDAAVTAGVRLVASKLLAGDANPAFRIMGDGQHNWGPGGATAIDTTLTRSAASTLRVGNILHAAADVIAWQGAATQVRIGNANGVATINFGSAFDTNLYRFAAGILKTDSALRFAPSTSNVPVQTLQLANFVAFSNKLAEADAQISFGINGNGTLNWGAGGSSAPDTNLSRAAADLLSTNDRFRIYGNSGVDRYWQVDDAQIYRAGSASTPATQLNFGLVGPGGVAGLLLGVDTNLYRLQTNVLRTDSELYALGGIAAAHGTANQIYIAPSGQIRFGASADTNLYRSAIDTLKTDDKFVAAGGFVDPSYGTSFPGSPVDGQLFTLVDSITNPSYTWHFRYNAGSTSPYKWEFIGGSPWITLQDTNQALAADGVWQNLGQITMPTPRTGDWLLRGNADCLLGPASVLTHYYAIYANTPGNDYTSANVTNLPGYWSQCYCETKVTIAAGVQVGICGYGLANALFAAMRWSMTPVRLS